MPSRLPPSRCLVRFALLLGLLGAVAIGSQPAMAQSLPSLSINSLSVTEGAIGGSTSLDFVVTLSAASASAVTVAYADAGTGTATSGTDYTALAAGTLTFAAGDTSKTVAVAVRGDALDEPVAVTLSGASNATLGTATGTGTITDDDATTTSLSIRSQVTAQNKLLEGSSGSKTMRFVVTLSPRSTSQVTVAYADARTGTAASGTDYRALAAGTLTFAAGTTSATVNVAVTGDTLDEPNETVVVELSDAVSEGANPGITTALGTGTITDNDAPPSLSISSPSVTEGAIGVNTTPAGARRRRVRTTRCWSRAGWSSRPARRCSKSA